MFSARRELVVNLNRERTGRRSGPPPGLPPRWGAPNPSAFGRRHPAAPHRSYLCRISGRARVAKWPRTAPHRSPGSKPVPFLTTRGSPPTRGPRRGLSHAAWRSFVGVAPCVRAGRGRPTESDGVRFIGLSDHAGCRADDFSARCSFSPADVSRLTVSFPTNRKKREIISSVTWNSMPRPSLPEPMFTEFHPC